MKNLEVIINYVLFCSCAVLPFSFQFSTIGVILFSCLSIFYSIKSKETFEINRLEILKSPFIIFLIPLIGLAFTNYVDGTIKLIIKYLPYLILSITYFFASDTVKNNTQKFICLGIIVGAVSVSLYLFFVVFSEFVMNNEENFLSLFSYKYTYNNFLTVLDSHPTYIGLLLLCAIYFIYKSKFNKTIKGFSIFIILCCVLFISSKIIFFLFLIQVFLLFVFLKNKKLKKGILFVSLALMSVIFYLYNNNLRDIYILQRLSIELKWDLSNSSKGVVINGRVSDDSRLVRWNSIIDKIEESVFFGFGSGSERSVLDEVYVENDLFVSLKRKYNTHNQFLFFIVENGILGLTVFICFISLNLIEAIKRRDDFIIFFIVALVLICSVENYFNRTMGVLLISVFLTFLKKTNEKNYFNF